MQLISTLDTPVVSGIVIKEPDNLLPGRVIFLDKRGLVYYDSINVGIDSSRIDGLLSNQEVVPNPEYDIELCKLIVDYTYIINKHSGDELISGIKHAMSGEAGDICLKPSEYISTNTGKTDNLIYRCRAYFDPTYNDVLYGTSRKDYYDITTAKKHSDSYAIGDIPKKLKSITLSFLFSKAMSKKSNFLSKIRHNKAVWLSNGYGRNVVLAINGDYSCSYVNLTSRTLETRDPEQNTINGSAKLYTEWKEIESVETRFNTKEYDLTDSNIRKELHSLLEEEFGKVNKQRYDYMDKIGSLVFRKLRETDKVVLFNIY